MANTTRQTIRRLQTIEGHLRRVRQMIEDDAYCIDIINQSKAVQRALAKVDELILEHHLRTCATKHIRRGKTDLATREIMSVFKHYRPS